MFGEIDDATKIAALDFQIASRTGKSRARKGRLYLWEHFTERLMPKARSALAKRVLADLGIKPTKMRYDIHAGCAMCSCSAGFILDGVDHTDIHANLYIVGSEKHLEAEAKLLSLPLSVESGPHTHDTQGLI